MCYNFLVTASSIITTSTSIVAHMLKKVKYFITFHIMIMLYLKEMLPFCSEYAIIETDLVGLAQLVRASDCGPEGRRFKPDIPPQITFYILASVVQRLVCKFSKLEMRVRFSPLAPKKSLKFFRDFFIGSFYWKKHRYAAAPTAAPRMIVKRTRKKSGSLERRLEGMMTVGRVGRSALAGFCFF